jgi:hypothetical protein
MSTADNVPDDIAPASISALGNYAVQVTWQDGFNQVTEVRLSSLCLCSQPHCLWRNPAMHHLRLWLVVQTVGRRVNSMEGWFLHGLISNVCALSRHAFAAAWTPLDCWVLNALQVASFELIDSLRSEGVDLAALPPITGGSPAGEGADEGSRGSAGDDGVTATVAGGLHVAASLR